MASCLVGSRGVGMVVGVALQAEQARVAEQPVGVPGVRRVLAHVPAAPTSDPGDHWQTSTDGRLLKVYSLQNKAHSRSAAFVLGESFWRDPIRCGFGEDVLSTHSGDSYDDPTLAGRCAGMLDGACACASPSWQPYPTLP